jgi:N-acyl-D-amino-acid deacylase
VTRLVVVLALLGAACAGGPPEYDVVLRHGWIVDGTGNPRYRGDVAITGDRVTAVGRVIPGRGRREIDATALVVAPGFIDMLGWSDVRLLADGRAVSKITQGITTEITGEGTSVGPQTDATFAEDSAYRASIGVTAAWRDLDGYFRALEQAGSTINVASFVGATQVRKVVLGDEDRAPTPAELARMVALVDTSMQQGAVGLSTALVYAPAFYASTDELVALARAAAARGGIYATHLRDEGRRIDDALDEAFRIGAVAGLPVEIWHLKRAGRDSWGDMGRILARIDSARASGLEVAANVYPYHASATSLDASIPQWAHAGGVAAMIARLRDPADRARIRADMEHPPGGGESFLRGAGGADGVLVSSVLADSLKYLEGRTLADIAAARGRDPIETLFDIVAADGANTGAIYFSMSEDDVRTAAAQWWVSFCTDYGAVAPDGPLSTSSVHPRVYGSFTRVLGRYVREAGLLPLEAAIRKMTSLPAEGVGLTDRGVLAPGFAADVTVFDPVTVIDRATFERPHQVSAGVRYVFVNGVAVVDDGQVTAARPGRGLRGPGWEGRMARRRGESP